MMAIRVEDNYGRRHSYLFIGKDLIRARPRLRPTIKITMRSQHHLSTILKSNADLRMRTLIVLPGELFNTTHRTHNQAQSTIPAAIQKNRIVRHRLRK